MNKKWTKCYSWSATAVHIPAVDERTRYIHVFYSYYVDYDDCGIWKHISLLSGRVFWSLVEIFLPLSDKWGTNIVSRCQMVDVQQSIRDDTRCKAKYNCAFMKTFLQLARNLLRIILYANTGEL